LRIAFDRARLRRAFTIDAIVLMPDHLHCIWTLPAGDNDISTWWAQIKHHYAVTRDFLNHYPRRLEQLLAPD
jgi:putative transposase